VKINTKNQLLYFSIIILKTHLYLVFARGTNTPPGLIIRQTKQKYLFSGCGSLDVFFDDSEESLIHVEQEVSRILPDMSYVIAVLYK
jgi:hypothetical protein